MTNAVRKFYDEIDPKRTPAKGSWNLRSVLAVFEPVQNARLLDIGCYDGSKTVSLASHIQAQEVYGVDFLSDRLEQASARGIQVAAADLNTEQPLPYPDSHFDVIFVGDVIEHIFSPDFLLMEIHRVLRPGAYVVLTTPNLASWRNRLVLPLGWQPFSTEVSTRYRVGNPRAPTGYPSGHIRVFTPRALRELVTLYGLQVERLDGLVIQGPRADLTKLTGWLDDLLVRLWPTLCDELLLKARKPAL